MGLSEELTSREIIPLETSTSAPILENGIVTPGSTSPRGQSAASSNLESAPSMDPEAEKDQSPDLPGNGKYPQTSALEVDPSGSKVNNNHMDVVDMQSPWNCAHLLIGYSTVDV